jgi:hypothetical protein
VCATCAQAHRAPERCVRCRQPGIIAYRARDGAICRRCYRAPRRRCGGCGRVRRIALSGRDGRPDLCGTCHWAAVATCERCGQHGACVGVRDAAPTCLRCLAAVRLDELLTGADGIAVPLAGLRDAFLAAQQPRSIHTWLDRSPARGLLRQLAVGELELSHESLDVLPQTPSLAHLRALPVAVHAVEHADDRRLLRAFATWRVLHRLRRRAEHRPTSPFAVKRARAQVAEAARLLAWLRSQDRALSDAGQADVDQWLAAGGHARQQIRSFLAWAAEHGSATALTIARTPPATAPLAVDAEARWTLARRLLHDDSIDPGDRVAGALVVLYAQPVARIARLRTDDIHHDGDDLFLRFGRDRVLMPGPLGELVAQLPWHRQVGPSGAVPAAAQWLFPGRHAGQPQHPEHLRRRLGRLGIDCRANRTAALLQLAAEVPAAVLADTLNIHRRTAVRWSQHAGGNWAHYAARRAHTDPSAASTNGPGPGWQG